MGIEYELGLAQGVRAQPHERGDVERFEHRVDADVVAIRHQVREVD
jgi:hypothetical protein